MSGRVRDDDHRSDELLEEHGRIAGRLGLAVAWTSGIRGEKTKRAADTGSGKWKDAAPLELEFAAGIFKERCRTRNPLCAAKASHLVLIEVDGDDELPVRLGLELPETVSARSRRGLHRYYHPPAERQPAKFQIDEGGVTHSEDGYLVMPPALHATGVVYEWISHGPIETLPLATLQVLISASIGTQRLVAERFATGEGIPEGHRHDFIFGRALTMAHDGLTEDEILPSMLVLGRERCVPPLSVGEIQTQVRGAVRRVQVRPNAQKLLAHELEDDLAAAKVMAGAGAQPAPISQLGVVATKPKLELVGANTVVARKQKWLVRGLIPLRTMTLLAGIGGLGKSLWSIQIGAALTQDGFDVAIVSFEDASEEVIRPRLEAAGAVLDKVGILVKEGGILSLPGDLSELVRLLRDQAVRLLIIDPVSAAISLKLDAHRDQDVRVVLGQLDRIARELDLAVLLIAHLNKAPASEAYIRIAGSVGFYNACRSVVTVTLDPDDHDHRLVAQHKANYSRLVPVQRHRIDEVSFKAGDELITTSKMVFVEEADDVDPFGVLATPERRAATKKDSAATLLFAMLADGEWHEREGLETMANARGVGRRTFDRAASDLGVESELRGYPARAWWRLPAAPSPFADDMTQQDESP